MTDTKEKKYRFQLVYSIEKVMDIKAQSFRTAQQKIIHLSHIDPNSIIGDVEEIKCTIEPVQNKFTTSMGKVIIN